MSTTAAEAPPSTNGATAKAKRPSLKEASAQIVKARSWVKSINVESDELVDLLFLSVVTNQPGWIVGEAGTGKSKVVRDVLACLPGTPEQKFIIQCFKDLDTQALFGLISAKGFMEDDFRHNGRGMLQESLWGYFDELADANDTFMRALLMALWERQYRNGNRLVDIPLRAAWATTNKWRTEREVAAVMDRFGWRYVKNAVETSDGFMRILRGRLDREANGGQVLTPPPLITIEALDVVVDAVAHQPVSDARLKELNKLRERAEKDGIIASPRRYEGGVELAKGRSVLRGANEVGNEDFLVYAHVLASDPAELTTVAGLCADFGGSDVKEAKELRKALNPLQVKANEIEGEIKGDGGKVTTERSQRLIALISDVKTTAENAQSKVDEAKRNGGDTSALEAVYNEATNTIGSLKELALGGMLGR